MWEKFELSKKKKNPFDFKYSQDAKRFISILLQKCHEIFHAPSKPSETKQVLLLAVAPCRLQGCGVRGVIFLGNDNY